MHKHLCLLALLTGCLAACGDDGGGTPDARATVDAAIGAADAPTFDGAPLSVDAAVHVDADVTPDADITPDADVQIPDAMEGSQSALTFVGGVTDSFADDTIGYRFTVGAEPITVTDLGFWDAGGNGLADAHDVGIFAVSSMAAVATATIPSGTDGVLEDGYRYLAITPVQLDANTTYVVLGYRPSAADAIAYNVSQTVAPFITYDTEVAANATGGLQYVNTPFGALNGWYGPGFKAEP